MPQEAGPSDAAPPPTDASAPAAEAAVARERLEKVVIHKKGAESGRSFKAKSVSGALIDQADDEQSLATRGSRGDVQHALQQMREERAAAADAADAAAHRRRPTPPTTSRATRSLARN